jgi:hypothetical protein
MSPAAELCELPGYTSLKRDAYVGRLDRLLLGVLRNFRRGTPEFVQHAPQTLDSTPELSSAQLESRWLGFVQDVEHDLDEHVGIGTRLVGLYVNENHPIAVLAGLTFKHRERGRFSNAAPAGD